MSDNKTHNIPENIRAMANAIKPNLILDGGKIPIPENAFEQSLEEGMTVAIVKQAQTAVQNFTRALDVAIGEYAIEQMAAVPTIDVLYAKTKVGHDTYNAAVDRTRSIPAGINQGRVDVYGHLTSGLTPPGSTVKKTIQKHLQAYGVSMLQNG